jgi:tetratricopeptide (TPR) repeat protein
MSRIALLLYASGHSVEAYNLLRTQQQRAPLDEIGELLKLELMVITGGIKSVPAYLSSLPPTDSIGAAPRLARVFRALRLRGKSTEAIEFASRVDPRVFAERGGDRALEELTRASEARSEALDRVTSILDVAAKLSPESAGLLAVRGSLAKERGEAPEAVAAAYVAALELDPDEPLALLGRARGLVDEDAKESLALASRALEADSVDTQRVTELALQLMNAGAQTEALELCRLVLKRTPHDGTAAQALATAALAAGDHSDRTLDFARRAARFARSERSMTLLRDTHAARGEQAPADKINERLEEWKQSTDESTGKRPVSPSSGSDAG